MDNESATEDQGNENIDQGAPEEEKKFFEKAVGVAKRIPVEMASEENDLAAEENNAEIADDRTLEQITNIAEDNNVVNANGEEPVRKSSAQASLDDVAEIPVELEAETAQIDEAFPLRKVSKYEGDLMSVPIEVVPYRPDILEIPIFQAPPEPQLIEVPITEVPAEPDQNEPIVEEPEEVVSEERLVSDQRTPQAEQPISKDVIEIPIIEAPFPFIEVPIQLAPEEPEIVEPATKLDSEKRIAQSPEATEVEAGMREITIEKPIEQQESLEKKVSFGERAQPARPILVDEEIATKRTFMEAPIEPSDAQESPKKRKSRTQLIEEVRRDLELQWDARGGAGLKAPFNPPAPPSHVTFSSRAPPRFHAPFFRPRSAMVDPEPKMRNEHTVGYVYVPPQMERLRQFDDYVKVGPYSMALWSTDKAMARSRSLERRGHFTTASEGYGPAPLRASRSASRSAPVSRSSSHSNLMDYVNATRWELRRSRSRSRLDESAGGHYGYDGNIVSSELLNEPPVFEKMALRTQNYVNALHTPYESTVDSYYGRYIGRPAYSPYVVAAHYDHLYPRDSYVKRRLNRWMENSFVPQSVRSTYEAYFGELENDLYKERERRSRLEREAFYSDREIDFARKQVLNARNAYSALDFSNFMNDNVRFRQNYARPYVQRPVAHIRRYFYPYA